MTTQIAYLSASAHQRQVAAVSASTAHQTPSSQGNVNNSNAQRLNQLNEIQNQITQRRAQASDTNQLNYAYDKDGQSLHVSVVNHVSGNTVRQIEYSAYHAMSISSHGYKGNYVDTTS